MIIDLSIWQNDLLLALILYFVIAITYRNGKHQGKCEERYKNYQKELEKSGNFFWHNGHRIAYPPKPVKTTLGTKE
jgi:hypothetical protein